MEVIDLNNEEEKETEIIENLEVEKKPVKIKKENVFIRFKNYISALPKKNKIILGIVLAVIIIIIIVALVFLLNKEEEPEILEEEPVVLNMGNYKYIDGFLYFYDSEEVELGSYECTVKDETLCYLSISENDGILDNPVKVYSDYSLVTNYVQIYEDLVFVNDNDVIYLYNLTDGEVLGEFLTINSAYDNYVILSDLDENYALVDLTDGYETVTEFDYDYIGYMNSTNNFVFLKNSDYGIMESDGSLAAEGIEGSVINYNENYIVSLSGSAYSLFNYDGKELLSGYDYFKIYEGYVYAFLDNLLYVYDASFNKINEIGIDITLEDDQNDYEIYSSEFLLTETEYIVDFEKLSDKTLKIEGTSYNVFESIINGSYTYANYILGTWYFYEDEDKTEVVGSYDCAVSNTVTSDSDVYSSCYVASKTDLYDGTAVLEGTLPIFYNNYVFIYDTQSLSLTDNIVLYDLKNSKTLANYSSVDIIGVDSYTGDIEFVDNDVVVLAKNTDKEYGMIKITSSGASAVIAFDYKSFSILNEYYVFTDNSGYKYLYEQDGTCLNSDSKIKSDISGYMNGYLIISTNGQKQIYGTDGTIISDAYDSLILEADVYLGIDSSDNIYVYTYEDNANNYFTEIIDVTYEYIHFEQVDATNISIVLYDSNDEEVASYHMTLGVL